MTYRRIEPDEAKKLLESSRGYTYLDVRTAEEFKAGHVPKAINVAVVHKNPSGPGMVPNPSFLTDVISKLGKDARVIVGCQRGGRSKRAAEMLDANGYTQVLEMRGGYDGELDPGGSLTFPGWARRGFPTESG